MNKKRAEMGMGTLIVFIAMILVAAVAASVLISTTGSLQNKALDTGKSTKQEVGTSMQVVEMYAEDGSSNTNVDEFVVVLKLNAGSDPLRFSDLLLTMNLENVSADYEYSERVNHSYGISCAYSLEGESAGNTSYTDAGGDFGVEYSITGPNNKTGYLTRGDVAKVCFEAPRGVVESEDVKVNLIPKVGTTNTIEITTPDLILNKRESMFP